MKSSLTLLLPFFLIMGVFFVMPLALIVLYSFLKAGPYGGVVWEFSWDAYTQILFEKNFDGVLTFNPAYLEVFLRSLKLAGICTPLCLLAGFPAAYHMTTRPPERRNLWIMLVTIPFWTNLLIRIYAWMLVLQTDGLINKFFLYLGITKEPLPLLYNDFAAGMMPSINAATALLPDSMKSAPEFNIPQGVPTEVAKACPPDVVKAYGQIWSELTR